MGLSREDREALQARAAGLHAEVSALRTERDLAVEEASLVQQDLALLQEVARLEQAAEAARVSRDHATGNVEDAMAVMNAVAEVSPIVRDTETEETDEVEATDDEELIVVDEQADDSVDGTEGDK